MAKNVILWIVIAVVLLAVFRISAASSQRVSPIDYSTFLSWVRDGSVEAVVFEGEADSWPARHDEPFLTYNPETTTRR